MNLQTEKTFLSSTESTRAQSGIRRVRAKFRMKQTVIRKQCVAAKCKVLHSSFNFAGSTHATYCMLHKVDGMINLSVKHRVKRPLPINFLGPGRIDILAPSDCDSKQTSRQRKIKELAVTSFLKEAFPSVAWTCNRVIGVSGRKPDMLCDLGEKVLIVEVDENQHANYSKTDENKRMMELSGDVDHRPVVFIRFNPDDYVDVDGVKHTSCFAMNKQGVTTVKKCKLVEWEKRLSTLRVTVEHWARERTPNRVEVVSLFFTAE